MLPFDPRALFEIPDDLAYFNCASVGPLPRAAREAIEAGAARRAQPWRVTMKHWIDEHEERRDCRSYSSHLVSPYQRILAPSIIRRGGM